MHSLSNLFIYKDKIIRRRRRRRERKGRGKREEGKGREKGREKRREEREEKEGEGEGKEEGEPLRKSRERGSFGGQPITFLRINKKQSLCFIV